MFRTDGKSECERSDQLYVDRRFSGSIESDHTCFNNDDDVYSNRHNR